MNPSRGFATIGEKTRREVRLMMTDDKSKVISDLEYDLLTVLQNKAEAIQTYESYIEDAQQANSQPCVELLQRLREQDKQQAQEIRRHLQEVMQKGKM